MNKRYKSLGYCIYREKRKPFVLQKRAQAVNPLLTPLNFSTPLRKVRYQKIADFAERCRFFCGKTARFSTNRAGFENFSVFHKKTTAILDRIRGTPSEI